MIPIEHCPASIADCPTVREPARTLPVVGRFDVLVAGGGPAGLGAALGAARAGARVALVERHGFLGGMMTAGAVRNIRQFTDREHLVVGGPALELARRLREAGGTNDCPERGLRVMQDTEITKSLVQEMVLEAGVIPYLHSWVADALCDGNQVTGLVVETKSGRGAMLAANVVDATGDGDVMARAEAGFECETQALQPMTLTCVVGGAECWPRGPGSAGYERMRSALEEGRFPCAKLPSMFAMPQPGRFYINGTRIPGNCTDARELTASEIEGRRQVMALVAWLRQNLPGFGRIYLETTAPQIGLRESRRLRGLHVMTREDVLECREYADRIARGAYAIDIHYRGQGAEMTWPPPGRSYTIPFRCLLPQRLDGLLASGRCLAATHDALGALRVMAICMTTGHAAGVAAALAALRGVPPRRLPIETLQDELRRQGAILDAPA